MKSCGPMFVARDDREYLWLLCRRIEDEVGVRVTPDHFVAILVEDLKAARAYPHLFTSVFENMVRRIQERAIEEDALYKGMYRRALGSRGHPEMQFSRPATRKPRLSIVSLDSVTPDAVDDPRADIAAMTSRLTSHATLAKVE